MVREVRLSTSVQSRHGSLKIVIHPQAPHGVVHSGVNPHGRLIGVVGCNLLIHLKQVAILGTDRSLTQFANLLHRRCGNPLHLGLSSAITLYRTGIIQIHRFTRLVDTESSIAPLFCRATRYIAWNKVSEGRIPALEIVIAAVFRNVRGLQCPIPQCLHIRFMLGNPNAPVVSQRLRHQCQFTLILPAYRDAGRVDLRVAGICHVGASPVGLPSCGHIGPHRIGAQKEHISIPPAAQHNGMGSMAFNFACNKVPGNDSPRLSVHLDHVHQFVTVVHGHFSLGNLTAQGTVGTQQQLLARLALGIKSPAHLDPAKRPVVQQSAVISCKRHALCHALVNDIRADFGKAVHVCFPAPVVASLDGIIEQAVHRVTVVLVVFGSVDAPLGRNGVGTPRAVLKTESLDVVAHFSQRRRC